MKVSVIVPARDSERTIGECVSALRRQSLGDPEIELLVVDDGSRDETARVAREAGARVLTIPPSGPAAARNRGVAETSGEIVLFTDADCVPRNDWIRDMTAPFGDEDVTGTKGVYETSQRELTARFVQVEYESRYARMRGRDSIDFVDTYAAGFRRALFEAIGGFDESFPDASVEDQEFSFRYARLPGRIVFAPSAVVGHRHADSPWRYFRKKMKIGFWKVRVMRRHPSKMVSDSHTPQGLKVEMLSVLGALVAAPFAWTTVGAVALAAFVSCFLLAALPFVIRALARDTAVGVVALGFQGLRALGLGLGCVAGALRGPRKQSATKPEPVADEIEETERCHELV